MKDCEIDKVEELEGLEGDGCLECFLGEGERGEQFRDWNSSWASFSGFLHYILSCFLRIYSDCVLSKWGNGLEWLE